MSRHPDKSVSNKRDRGFTLVEVVVALAVMTIGLVPVFVQASAALNLAYSVRSSLTATYLAQEGVEVAAAIRDNNWFANPKQPFDTNLNGCAAGCTAQYDSTTLTPVGGSPQPLLFDASTGKYQYTTGTASIFTRVVTITTVSPTQLKVISTVTWMDRNVSKSYQLEYHLYDWLP